MSGTEIHAGDLLAVDKHLKADHGHIVVAVVEGDSTVLFGKLAVGMPITLPAPPAKILTPEMAAAQA